MKKLLSRIRKWFFHFFKLKKNISNNEWEDQFPELIDERPSMLLYGFEFQEDFPEHLKEYIVYIIGEEEYYWLLVFYCPCGCKEIIQLNTLIEANPNWTYFIKKERITIHPSIWRTTGCRSHFFLRKGEIIWTES